MAVSIEKSNVIVPKGTYEHIGLSFHEVIVLISHHVITHICHYTDGTAYNRLIDLGWALKTAHLTWMTGGLLRDVTAKSIARPGYLRRSFTKNATHRDISTF